MERRVQILDSTLRDGAQAEGISFSVEDKLHILTLLDSLGIGLIEVGTPSTPKDDELFSRLPSLSYAHPVAFGPTCRKNTPPEKDDALCRLLKTGVKRISLFGKCDAFQAEAILGTRLQENLRMIEESCRFLSEAGREVFFDAEHFFNGYASDPSYTLDCLTAAVRGGAKTLCLCDTNGGSLPSVIARSTKEICSRFPDITIAIHCHNDSGTAVAASIAAVEAGASQVQGTLLGIGERCGNAALSSVIPDLQLKCETGCIPDDKLPLLEPVSVEMAELCNQSLPRSTPFVGRSAFAHKAGTHVDGVLKDPRSFEHIPPESVGNTRRMLTSEMSGRAGILQRVQRVVPDITHDSPELASVLAELKRLEHLGYQFEGAEASFTMLVSRCLNRFTPSFSLLSYKVIDELPYPSGCSATATIKISVDGKTQVSAAEGDGPVNALDKALREALAIFYPVLSDVRLIDYKVRVLEPKDATAGTVRVLITSTDGKRVWTTVGLSENIIEASWHALVDSIEYKLQGISNG